MFGRQNDVIAQDQKQGADVPLQNDALSALTKPPATNSQTDSPSPPTSAPAPSPPSVDSFSPIPASGAAMIDPFDLVQKPVPGPATIVTPTNDIVADTPAPATADDDGTLLGGDEVPATDHLDGTDEPQQQAQTEPVATAEQPDTPPAEAPSETADTTTATSDQLLSIKQEALSHLSPLVGQLNLAAEDKYRTLMMLIQASDNQGLIPEAYTAAQQIENEQVRAQALLDIVNEINYFTKKKDS